MIFSLTERLFPVSKLPRVRTKGHNRGFRVFDDPPLQLQTIYKITLPQIPGEARMAIEGDHCRPQPQREGVGARPLLWQPVQPDVEAALSGRHRAPPLYRFE